LGCLEMRCYENARLHSGCCLRSDRRDIFHIAQGIIANMPGYQLGADRVYYLHGVAALTGAVIFVLIIGLQ